jgi:chitin disaccharide deacetylase
MSAESMLSCRSVVLHGDDVAMTHGANSAFAELFACGSCSAGSVMVPCPWFPEAADLAVTNRELDVGVHLTLTSEKRPYRWRPLTAPPRSAGITDEFGYFWADVTSVRRSAVPEAVEIELRAQIDTALATGIDVTHLDGHMGAAYMPEFVDIYLRLGRDYRVPILLVKDIVPSNPVQYSEASSVERYNAVVAEARKHGFPIFEMMLETPWHRVSDAETTYREIFRNIPLGLSFLAFHFNAPGDFDVVEPEEAHIRTEEYALFRTPQIAKWLQQYGLEAIGFRKIRDDLRSHWAE